jgi:hypothetical protein
VGNDGSWMLYFGRGVSSWGMLTMAGS